MPNRIRELQHLLQAHTADALWITSPPNIRWACGFTGSRALLLVRADGAHFFSDGRYTEQAIEEVDGASVHAADYDLIESVAEEDLLPGGFDVIFQAEHLSVAQREELAEKLPNVVWRAEENLLVHAVAKKTPDEIASIRAAQSITEDVYEFLLGWLTPDRTEKEVAAEIVYQHLLRGADCMSFEPIVASGANSALPHARPTARKLAEGDVVLLDFGCSLDGYASDMSRTVVLGRPDDEVRKVYELVLSAQMRAIDEARAGIAAKALDAAARDVLKEGGYGEYFTHGLGHGVGLQVHEWPRVSYRVEDELPADCVVSVEPGVYLPRRFGIRIEDLIVLRADGCELLTAAPKEWTVLR